MITTNDLLIALGGQPLPQAIAFTDVVQDSRLVTPGCLFVALRGETQDGHAFIAEALQRGAAAILAERVPEGLEAMATWSVERGAWTGATPPILHLTKNSLQALQQLAAYWRSKHEVEVIGVTGSVGKTSTKEMIAAVLERRFSVLKNEKNLNNEIGLPLSVLQLTSAHQKAVLEMGMYDLGEIALLCQIARPSIGVVTNVGLSHLERLGSLERIAQAKAELVQALPADGVAILNGDDPRVRAMAGQMKGNVFLYGQDVNGRTLDLWADEVESHGLEGIHLRLHRGNESVYLRVPLLGEHSVHTVLAAAAVGLVENLTWEEIDAGLSVVPEQLRLVVISGLHGSTLIDDTYNSSPASALAALNLLAELEGRRVAVLGDMLELGIYEDEGHKLVGRRAREVVSRLVAVGSRGWIIGQEAVACGMPQEHVALAANNTQAIAHLKAILQPGDYVLIKGSRGLKMEEIVAGVREE